MKSGFLLLLLFGFTLFSAQRLIAQDEVSDLLGRINALRSSQGLHGYTLNGALSGAAQSQAQWMIDNGCAVAHVRPDGSSPRTRAAAFGYPSTDVSENIYCGSNATTNTAWVFWINSAIHYRGLVNARYQEIGIGVAHGAAGAGYVLVFGNPSGQVYIPPAPAGSSGSDAPQTQPSYVLGLDEHGNIMHEIQQDETLGDIALIYGYTWADIPYMLTLNGLTQADIRLLQPGSVFLVPPKSGTYTPTPGGETPTPTYTPFVEPTLANTWTPEADDALPQPTLTPVPTHIVAATANDLPQAVAMLLATATLPPSATAAEVVNAAAAGGSGASNAGVVITRSSTSPWLAVALLVQAGVLLAAGVEFVRRKRKR